MCFLHGEKWGMAYHRTPLTVNVLFLLVRQRMCRHKKRTMRTSSLTWRTDLHTVKPRTACHCYGQTWMQCLLWATDKHTCSSKLQIGLHFEIQSNLDSVYNEDSGEF